MYVNLKRAMRQIIRDQNAVVTIEVQSMSKTKTDPLKKWSIMRNNFIWQMAGRFFVKKFIYLFFWNPHVKLPVHVKFPREGRFLYLSDWKVRNQLYLTVNSNFVKGEKSCVITLRATTSSGLLSTYALNTWANPPWPAHPLISYLFPP